MIDKEKLVELRNKCITIGVFEYDNELLVLGNKDAVILKYLQENPSKKFRIWLIDSGLVITESKLSEKQKEDSFDYTFCDHCMIHIHQDKLVYRNDEAYCPTCNSSLSE